MNKIHSYTTTRVDKTAAVFLRVSAAVLSFYAVIFILKPDLLGDLVGFSHHSPNTLVEVTAFYGGLEIGLAIFLLWSTKSRFRIRHALMAIFFIFLATGLARFFGILRFGFENPIQPVIATLEFGWSLIAYWLAEKLLKY